MNERINNLLITRHLSLSLTRSITQEICLADPSLIILHQSSPPVTFILQLGPGSSEMRWSQASLNQEGSLGVRR